MGRLWRWLRMQMTGGSSRPPRSYDNAIDAHMSMRSDHIDDLRRRVAVFEERLGIEQQIEERRHDGGL